MAVTRIANIIIIFNFGHNCTISNPRIGITVEAEYTTISGESDRYKILHDNLLILTEIKVFLMVHFCMLMTSRSHFDWRQCPVLWLVRLGNLYCSLLIKTTRGDLGVHMVILYCGLLHGEVHRCGLSEEPSWSELCLRIRGLALGYSVLIIYLGSR